MRRSTSLCLVFSAALVGLIIGRYLVLPVWPLVLAAVVLILMRRNRLVVSGCVLIALSLGIWRAGVAQAVDASLTAKIGVPISITGTVADDPGITATGGTAFKLGNLVIDGRPTPGQLPVYMQRINLHRGWQVSARGKLKEGFGNAPVELSYPVLKVISTHQSLLEQGRQRFFVGMKTALPEPDASFGLGLLIGIRSLIPKDLQTQLALVGLSHLVAVSGYNLTILVRATERLLGRFGRNVTLAGSFWLIGVFVMAAGGSASIVRAALVSGLGLVASYYGRQFKPMVIITLAAAVTALYKPANLTDYGWLLSFTAFFGIMVVAPAITARLKREPGIVGKMFIETMCAQVLTFPLIAYGFGQLSLISPVANIIELPLVPAAMLLSLTAGVGGMMVPAFAGWVAWPAHLLLAGMLWLVRTLASIPGAGQTLHLGFLPMLGIYGVIAGAVAVITRSGAPRHRPLQSPALEATVLG